MSALSDNQEVWSIASDGIDSKYEKCRNITEEIYKRINITFQIKKLETGEHSNTSDHSDQIDSNELGNETDLFACDKSDSISSSTEAEKPIAKTCEKYININNNEETKMKKTTIVHKRPRKRFRKRVKKRQSKTARSDTEGSSDEALPLSRIIEDGKCVVSEHCANSESPDRVMGVPNIVILTRDLKPKTQQSDKRPQTPDPLKHEEEKTPDDQKTAPDRIETRSKEEKGTMEWKHCTLCSLTFRGERGLRRHVTMSHIIQVEETKKPAKPRDKASLDG